MSDLDSEFEVKGSRELYSLWGSLAIIHQSLPPDSLCADVQSFAPKKQARDRTLE
ncbi:hypothetical protein [Tychonema sp. BBK16]|uniref:hypothetical protein n=1 Tax=Tychonema sp. BBK16 TaxID=2699888 RepID=UPI001F3FE8CC|nr:hypothetical protein [Tychonema sp. BBK16]MCF6374706.1 hypothetical protein [Tychonema sp. BBK16]